MPMIDTALAARPRPLSNQVDAIRDSVDRLEKLLPEREDSAVVLDFIELPEGVSPQWATSRHLFATRPDGTLLMTSRAP